MKNNTDLKYIMYCRKSSDSEDRQVQSIPDQKKELQPLVDQRDLNVIKVFGESQSAKKPGRPEYNEMLQMLKTGEADGIICWKLNRLSRNPVDGGEIQWLLQQNVIKSIITPGREYLPTDNVLMMAVELGMANQYVLDLSKDVKRGYTQKAARGVLPTGSKPGYVWDSKAERGAKEPLPDPERFHLIERAFKIIVSGTHTPMQVYHMLNDKWNYRTPKKKHFGGNKMGKSTFYRMLVDPFYHGQFEYPPKSGNWHQGTHQTMITEEEHEKVLIILGKNDKPKHQKQSFPYTGLMRCGECEAAITAEDKWQCICTECKHKFSCKHRNDCPSCGTIVEEMDNPTLLHFTYYHCTKRKNIQCTQKTLEVTKLEKQVDDFLSRITVSERFQKWAIKKLNEENAHEVTERKRKLSSLQKSYDDIIERISNLTSLRISPDNVDGELLSNEEFAEQKKSLLARKIDIKTEMKRFDARVDDWTENAEKMFNFARYARHHFNNGTKDDKKAIMRALGLNLVLKDKIFGIHDPSVFLTLKKTRDAEPSISDMFEPEKMDLKAHKVADIEEFWDKSPVLQGCQDSNPN
ncbi:MAG: recombinase family protein [Thermodesulfobacteriota bacterium]